MLIFILVIIFAFLSILYHETLFGQGEFSNLFLSISTFLFATFAGFFIARQGRRYSSIRTQIANFDGIMSTVFRHFVFFGKAIQTKAEKIVVKHYKTIIKHKSWDYHFSHKSDTIKNLSVLLLEAGKKKNDGSALSMGLVREGARILKDLQIARKQMILLHQEDIPKYQWVLLIFLAVILLVSVSMIPSQGDIVGSMLKGAFGTCVVLILVLLRRFNDLTFFESTIGESSAQDILDIIDGKK